MLLIDLNKTNNQIIDEHFLNLCCDLYTESHLLGGQSIADEKLSNLDITNYSKKRNNVLPKKARGASNLSPYIRHGLLNLIDVWNRVENFDYEDKNKFRDELLWQEFSRHIYSIVSKKSKNELNFHISTDNNFNFDTTNKMNCISNIKNELEKTGYIVNQTRMWFASHFGLRDQKYWNLHEDYMFKHLLDGSRFANRLGWHWVMGSQTGKLYGFAKNQVLNRANELCNNCDLKYNCPIESWPNTVSIDIIEQNFDLDSRKNFGPDTTLTDTDLEPDYVWLTGESLGDNDPALKFYDNLPVIFVFDEKLLKSIKISTKRINFLLQTLKELNEKKELFVYIGDPIEILKDKKIAVTFAPVPKYKYLSQNIKPLVEFPAVRLVKPIDFYPSSYSSWKKQAKLNI